VNRDRFIRERNSDWQQFEELLSELKSLRRSRWGSSQVTQFARLYRSICYDLSLVQSREWGSKLETYLNALVAQGHNLLYRSPPRTLKRLWHFFARRFPQLVRQRYRAILIASGLFLIPMLIATLVAITRPDLAELVAGHDILQQAIEPFQTTRYEDTGPRYTSERSRMFGFYVNNNTSIAFRAFAMGALAGVGTCLILISNGLSIGMVQGAVIAAGPPTSGNFFSFAISHGAFELTAIVIAGAAGLVLAQGVFLPGQLSRREALRFHGLESLQLALGAGAMLFVAALIEGYFSPLPILSVLKYITGAGLWLLVFAYLSLAGMESREP
jgi:uncharacterized membrane protein SpoIIM required for sporulation